MNLLITLRGVVKLETGQNPVGELDMHLFISFSCYTLFQPTNISPRVSALLIKLVSRADTGCNMKKCMYYSQCLNMYIERQKNGLCILLKYYSVRILQTMVVKL